MLVDFANPVITEELLRAILTTPFEELYMCYFKFEILISNGLPKTRNGAKV